MVKKGIYGAADTMMREANKLKQSMKKYNWEFVKYTAKLKLKQNEAMLQMSGLRKDQSEI
jgi:hypothetical protein